MLLEYPHPGEDAGLPQGRDENDDEDEPREAARDVVPTLGERHVERQVDGVELGGGGRKVLVGRRPLSLQEAPEGEAPRFALICCLRPLQG